jgi:hypothetical protein
LLGVYCGVLCKVLQSWLLLSVLHAVLSHNSAYRH